MKQLLILLLLICASFGARAQSSAWTFALPVADLNGAMAVATGPDGNVYLTGRFTGSLDLGGTVLSSSQPGPCLFIAKVSPAGQVLRATKLEGATDVLPRAIAVDKNGNSYVTGSFLGTLSYAGGSTSSQLQSASGSAVFLLKCGANGQVRWVQQADGQQSDQYGGSYGTGVAVDPAGNSYICGLVNGSLVRFGARTFGAHRRDGFVASYTSQGQMRWAQVLTHRSATTDYYQPGDVGADGAGSCYLLGHSAGGWTLGSTALVIAGEADYLARFDAGSGRPRWAKAIPGNGARQALALDKLGDVCIGGGFSGTVAFDGITLTSDGDADGYVARYDPTGDLDWVTALGGPNYDVVGDIAVDQKTRKVFASGMMNYTSAGTNQAFLATLNANGRVKHTERVGGPGTSSSGSLALDDDNNVYSTGIFTGSCHFGALERNSTATQAYLARYGSRQHGRNAGNDDNDDFHTPALNLFPNPAQNQLTLRLTDPAGAGQATLYNHLGRPVASHAIQPTAADISFDTSALPDGLYVLRVAAQGKTTTQMVTVQH
ncbi:SBBP repeat-containing protein [Hymenobacter artigasi]|uniref:Secretion system C-terminal sorting domain-containing protein n=1 Tax=Hymenobacter artigasi TaxID=2719616 RepID=A0ABX1HHC6_9BACT|nr:SBBP repeat-containing protein [Hymenobacter artigasi]NKI88178.1 hypothetical protein [Hymenobacter artigasi]